MTTLEAKQEHPDPARWNADATELWQKLHGFIQKSLF